MKKPLTIIVMILVLTGMIYLLFFFTYRSEVTSVPAAEYIPLQSQATPVIQPTAPAGKGTLTPIDRKKITATRILIDTSRKVVLKPAAVRRFAYLTDSAYSKVGVIVTPPAIMVSGWKSYRLSNTLTQKDLYSSFRSIGVTPKYSTSFTKDCWKLLKGRTIKSISVAMMAGGAVFTFEEYLFPELSFAWRLGIAAGIAVLCSVLYLWLVNKGVFE